MWQRELRGDVPGVGNQLPTPRTRPAAQPPPDRAPAGNQPPTLVTPRTGDRAPTTAAANSPAAPPSLYSGARSGTLQCSGGPIPQNGEYVFRNLPLLKIQLDYDTKNWEARLAPGEGQTQRVILKNKSSGPQKRCVVHWSVIP
jgi:hypothetical protein